jgi:hypothetical protein
VDFQARENALGCFGLFLLDKVEGVFMQITGRYERSEVRITSSEGKDPRFGGINDELYNF